MPQSFARVEDTKPKRSAQRNKPLDSVTRDELAVLERVSPATVVRWQRAGCPAVRGPGRRTRYDVAAVRAWRQATRRDGKRGRRPAAAEAMDAVARAGGEGATPAEPAKLGEALGHHADLTEQRARKERALADYHELRVKRLRGQLLDARDVEAGRVARIHAVKAALLGLADRVAPGAVGRDEREVRSLVENEVIRILEGFARE